MTDFFMMTICLGFIAVVFAVVHDLFFSTKFKKEIDRIDRELNYLNRSGINRMNVLRLETEKPLKVLFKEVKGNKKKQANVNIKDGTFVGGDR